MNYQKSYHFRKIATQAVSYLIGFGFLLWIFLRIFYHDQVVEYTDEVTSNHPILVYSIVLFITGTVTISHYKDIESGKERNFHSIYLMLLFIGGFVYSAIKLIGSISNKL